jgi:hypothetical protein
VAPPGLSWWRGGEARLHGAADGGYAGDAVRDQPREPKVRDDGACVRRGVGAQDVGRLQVTVGDANLVQVLHADDQLVKEALRRRLAV